jgi:hypothetical protein
MLEDLQRRHPSVGATRNIGLFGIVELVRNRETREPMAPFNGTSPEMQALGKFFRAEGLYTLVRWNTFFTNPPLCITEAEMREAFAILDKGTGDHGSRGSVETAVRVRSQKSEGQSQRSEVRGQKSEVRRSGVRSQRSEVRESEVRSQRSEVRGQSPRSEDQGLE